MIWPCDPLNQPQKQLNSYLTTRPCAGAIEELSSISLRCNKTWNPSLTSCLHSSSVCMLPVYPKGLPSQPPGSTKSLNSLLICSAHSDTNMGLRFIGVHITTHARSNCEASCKSLTKQNNKLVTLSSHIHHYWTTKESWDLVLRM